MCETVALVAAPAAAQGPHREVIRTGSNVTTLPVFSAAIRTGDLLFLSGQIGTRPGEMELPEGIEAQVRNTFENIKRVLAAAGATLDDVVKCTVFLADMDDYQRMNAVYREYFPKDPPARSTIGANGLALGALTEIECIAAAPR